MHFILKDEDFPQPAASVLTELGHDILTLNDLGLDGQGITDEQLVVLAASVGRAILTHNRRDFVKLHRRSSDHTGLIVCSRFARPEDLARAVHESISAFESLNGQLIQVYRPSV